MIDWMNSHPEECKSINPDTVDPEIIRLLMIKEAYIELVEALFQDNISCVHDDELERFLSLINANESPNWNNINDYIKD